MSPLQDKHRHKKNNYTPVIKHRHSNGKSPFSIGNTSSKGSFSIAMLDYQRVWFSEFWMMMVFCWECIIPTPAVWPGNYTLTEPLEIFWSWKLSKVHFNVLTLGVVALHRQHLSYWDVVEAFRSKLGTWIHLDLRIHCAGVSSSTSRAGLFGTTCAGISSDPKSPPTLGKPCELRSEVAMRFSKPGFDSFFLIHAWEQTYPLPRNLWWLWIYPRWERYGFVPRR